MKEQVLIYSISESASSNASLLFTGEKYVFTHFPLKHRMNNMCLITQFVRINFKFSNKPY